MLCSKIFVVYDIEALGIAFSALIHVFPISCLSQIQWVGKEFLNKQFHPMAHPSGVMRQHMAVLALCSAVIFKVLPLGTIERAVQE